MAASSKPKRNHEVFLNFRGTDVRNNFLSHLYIAFDGNGIHSFVDSEELRKGEEISPALMRAIEESHIAIIIFSEEYAFSPWCLEELVKIMECKEQKGLKVLPVFYKVEPREVKVGRKSYGRNMAKHELKFGKDLEKVKRWKKTLFDAGNLSGWDMNNRDEVELIQCIVNELSFNLNRRPLYVTKYPVEIDSQVQKLIWLIQQESADDGVLMIGLWGPGGIGKTTIAKALYNAMERKFQGCSFLEQVREKSNRSDGLVALQRDLLYEILVHKSLMIYSVGGGISLIRERLYKHLLTSHRMNCVYEIKPLEYDKARELFHQHAFPNSRKVGLRRDLIDRALHYADSLPLALEVLGSFLYGREESVWDSTLHKLSKSPDQTINRVLKTSFDGLGGSEREIFLDIACFFKGKRIEYIKEVLDSCDYDPIIGIEIRIERSLIKNVNGTLQMHDLVQLMGKDIVKQECPNDPRKRSSFVYVHFIESQLLHHSNSDSKIKYAIKAIVLDLPTPEEMTISPNAFTNMKRLRMFIMPKVHIFSRGPICLPNELSWLEWANYPDLEFGLGQKKLVRLYVKNGHIKQLGGNFQNFINLKSIEFCDCKLLAIVPDLSSAPNLERLYLLRCESLVEINQSAGYLDKLKLLSISSCSNLRIFPNTLKTKSLQNLDLSYCYKLEKCPDIPEKMEHLQHLDLQWTAIKELPTSIENLVSVETIDLGYCENLTRLPSSIHKLKNLKALYLYNYSNLAMFPKNLEDPIDPDGDLGFPSLSWLDLCDCNLLEVEFLESASSCPALTHLDLSNNKFTHLPTCINKYDYWKDLFVYSCKESKGVSVADVSPLKVVEILVNGREMPEWILQCKEDSISFMIPPDLRGNFLGLALCVILGQNKKRTFENLFEVRIFVNGKREYFRLTFISPLESDHVKLVYIPSDNKRGEEKLLQNNWSHIQVCFGAPEGSIKKRGFRLICEQREDDLRVCFPTPSADGNKLEFQGKILEDNSQSMKKIIQWD
ncbi:hypothetical protein EUGRSUZ_L02708 [Eucalyptus grandis]|uniref:TIR domain-containing protein n=1 Tax=Eucalyptus grandis TaxID=71139 RepID=A0AAD9WHG2_EUCGR|nr:hypothetical protein EUGRSUZ_L02708 [Eucalyptus grandis]